MVVIYIMLLNLVIKYICILFVFSLFRFFKKKLFYFIFVVF